MDAEKIIELKQKIDHFISINEQYKSIQNEIVRSQEEILNNYLPMDKTVIYRGKAWENVNGQLSGYTVLDLDS